MIMNIGVVIEIISMLAFGRMLRALGARRFFLLGAILMGIRMALLAIFPSPAVAIGIQVFHGMMVLLLQVGPIVLIDRLAKDRFRNSLQGLYLMAVIGGGRIAGNLVVGPIAAHGYQLAFGWSTALVISAFLLLLLAYRPAETT
jgi:MFS family permease